MKPIIHPYAKKHQIHPYEKQENIPEDLNDPVAAATAVELHFPVTFSAKAKKVVDYFDGTMFLYAYKGKFVVTDEALSLTEHGDGSHVAPFGGPRFVCATLDEVEAALEAIADDYDKYGDMEGWEVDKDNVPKPPAEPDHSKERSPHKVWAIVEMFCGMISSLYCVSVLEQVEQEMKDFIHTHLLDQEPLTCVFADEYISCADEGQRHEFIARLTDVDQSLPRPKLNDPYHLHPLPMYDVCVDAMALGFTTIFDARTLIHTPLGEFTEDMNATDYGDTYGYVRFGHIIISLTDAWEEEAVIYELE